MAKMGRVPIYPWEEWFDGGRHTIQHGIDFDVEPLHMQKHIQSTARRRGLPITTSRRGGTIEIGPRNHGFATIDNSATEMAPNEEDDRG
jgi:hypothetical protein